MKTTSRRMAVIVAAGGLATMIVPSAGRADEGPSRTYRVDLSVVCISDTMIRVAASNDSPRDIVVSAQEVRLSDLASDELRAIFPLTIPAQSQRVTARELSVPAHQGGVARRGLLRYFHGTWSGNRWHDENGWNYVSTGGIDLRQGARCPAELPATNPTTTAAATTTSIATTTSATTSVATTAASTSSVATTQPATTQPATTQPATTQPSTTQPATTQPATTQPATTQPETTTAVTTTSGLVVVAPRTWRSTTNSQLAALAFDDNPATAFVTQMDPSTPPLWASLTADLGRAVALHRIEWMWSASGVDDAIVRVSADGRTWTDVGAMADGEAQTWLGLDTNLTARYVKFGFRNPNHDPQLGNIAEVHILAAPDAAGLAATPKKVRPYGPPSAETHAASTLTPDVDPVGTLVTGLKAGRSSNAPIGSAGRTLDGDPSTVWATSMTVAPWSAYVSFDMGGVRPLRTVRWTIADPSAADSYRVQVSNDGAVWTTVSYQANPSSSEQWQTLLVDVDARYVRLYFRNPNHDPVLGTVGEVQLFAA